MTLVLAMAVATAPAAPARRAREWYGWQTALVDAGAGALFVAGWASDQELPAGIGTVMFVAGGPAIHTGHRQLGQALASLGLRIVLPLLGSFAATAADARTEWGLAGGAVPAAAFDAIALAWRVTDE